MVYVSRRTHDETSLTPSEVRELLLIVMNAMFFESVTRAEVPEVISAEQRCFIVLAFFSADSENMINISADSENMINISADQLCFRADQL